MTVKCRRPRYSEVFVPVPRSRIALVGALATGLLIAPGGIQAHAQTTAASVTPATVSDPLERMNRGLYSVHTVLDKAIVRPVMLVYTTALPGPLRAGLRNVVGNLGEPITFVNDVLQVRPRAASRTLTRFATNSVLGVGGIFDLAATAGYPRHYSDFGQTLGRYGVGTGPFLFIPVLGPSTVRDISGRVVDRYADPVNMIHYDGDEYVRYGRPVITGLELRATFDREIQELGTTATDPYVTLRSAYLQNRQNFIRGGEVEEEDVQALPSFSAAEPAPTVETTTTVPIASALAPPYVVASVKESFFRSN